MILVLFTSSDSACAHKIHTVLTAKEEKVQLLSIENLDLGQILQQITDLSPQKLFFSYEALIQKGEEQPILWLSDQVGSSFGYSVLFYPLAKEKQAWNITSDDYLPSPVSDAMLMGVVHRASGGAVRVLFAEDDRVQNRIVTGKLEQSGFEVMSCENGKEGCANILQFFPDVIISDLNMPEMDGFTFLETVKKNPYTANIPFLVTSALVEADDIQKALSLGAADYITKPFDFREVQQKLNYYTRNRGKDRKKVLVVDDARISRELLKAPMAAEGFRVFQAENGREGLEVAQRENIDLILSDYSMPEMDGWDFCRALKKNPETEHIPVVMVTGKTSEMDRKIGRSLKIADYVTKPFTPEIIKNTVNMVFLEEMGRKEREEREKLEGELKIGHDIQHGLLPERLRPPAGKLQASSLWIPARQLGGDFFDELYSESERNRSYVIADVSGKGLPAALIAVASQAALRTACQHTTDPATLLGNLNSMLCETTADETFITCFVANFDLATNKLEFASAGHHGMMLFRSSTGEVELIGTDDPPCGLISPMEFQASSMEFESGDVLLLFTDGLLEAEGKKQEMYGEERLAQKLKEHSGNTAPQIKEAISEDIESFIRNRAQVDDRTMIVVKVV